VYLARDKRLKRPVAIKLLPPELAFRSEIRSRFLREAETAAQLSHPSIVPIYSVDEKDGLVFFVMAFVDAVDRDDARVRELRRRLRLAEESRTDLGAERELGRQELDRDRPLETAILRAIHDPHAAATDLPIELIRGIEHALDVRAQLGVRLRDLRFFHFAGYGSRRNGEHSTAPYKDTRQRGLG
jgi:serine/threonine protein kinase